MRRRARGKDGGGPGVVASSAASAASAAAVAAVAAVVVLAGCAAAPRSRAAGAVTPLSVRAVMWNPSNVPVGHVRAVADAGDVVAVFGDEGATVFSSGAPVAVDRSVKDWVDAATIRGADGSPRWIVGIDARGHLRYLRGLTSFEDVSARYALDGVRVLGATMLDGARTAFLLDGAIALADGRRVSRYATARPLFELSGGGGWCAGVSPDLVMMFDAARLAPRTYALPGAKSAAVGPDGHLYAATSRALYEAPPGGDLSLVYDALAHTLHGLAVSGREVWFADGGELGMVERGHVAETTGAKLPPDAKLSGSPSGDVWVIGGGRLQRFARADAQPASLAVTWTSAIAPVFARACASCHLPAGISGIDLSTAAAWQAERAAIDKRVLVDKTMPPEGHPISDADREAIRAWLNAGSSPPAGAR
jgi:mono/diheme cytochrome c family protein